MNEPQFLIEMATTSHTKDLYQIGLAIPELQLINNRVFMDPDEFLDAIIDPFGVFLVAVEAGRPVGFIYAKQEAVEDGCVPRRAYLMMIAVLPEKRRQGIGKALTRECLSAIKGMGINTVSCYAIAEGKSLGVNLLQRMGFFIGQRCLYTEYKF